MLNQTALWSYKPAEMTQIKILTSAGLHPTATFTQGEQVNQRSKLYNWF